MTYQQFIIAGVASASVLLSACSAAETEEPGATTESLQSLRLAVASQASPAARASITRAGLRLCDLQADRSGDNAHNGLVDDDPDDGGWDWQTTPTATAHSNIASSTNLYGATGMGIWAGLQLGGARPRFRAALLDAYLGMQESSAIRSAPDFVLLALLSERYDDQRYAALARERYDARIAAAGSASQLAVIIRDGRHAAGADGLIAYDLAWFGLAALVLSQAYPGAGYYADFEHFTATVVDDLNASSPDFDYRDPHEGYYVTGLAWSMLVSSWAPRSRAVFTDLRSRLMNEQLADGAWPYGADYPTANLQATAHALIALGLTKHAPPHAIGEAAVTWLASQQNDNGGWAYEADQEYPLTDGEAALGIYLVGAGTAHAVTKDIRKATFVLSATHPAAAVADVPPPAAPENTH